MMGIYFLILTILNVLLLCWSIYNCYDDYNFLWVVNTITSFVFSIFWGYNYIKYKRNEKRTKRN